MARRYLRSAAVWAASFVLLASACRGQDRPSIRLWALAPPEVVSHADDASPPLRLAMQLSLAAELDYPAYRAFADILAARTGIAVQPVLRRTSAEIADLVRSGQADAVYAMPGGPPDRFPGPGLVPVAIPVAGGSTAHRSFLVMAAGAESWPKDGVLAVGSVSGARLQGLRGAVAVPGRYRRLLAVSGYDRAIRAVADGLVDGALVDGLALARLRAMQPALVARIRLHECSPPEPNPPVAASAAMPAERRAALAGALLALHREPAGRSAVARLGLERFVAPRREWNAEASR